MTQPHNKKDMAPRTVRWPCQLGAAITLPWPTTIYVKSLPMSDRLRKHEEVHVAQINRMGGVKYLLTHIWARIVTLDLYARKHPIEAEAYAAEG